MLDKKNLSKLAIIAGRGDLPQMIIEKCQAQNVPFIIITIKNQPYNFSVANFDHFEIEFGEISKALKILEENNVQQLVFAGGVNKPSMTGIKFDAKGAILISKILSNRLFGDDNLLSTVLRFFEKSGFEVIGADEIIDDLTVPKGVLTKAKPNKENLVDIAIAQKALQDMAHLDIGQAVAVQQKQIIGVEAIEGTDALMGRCKDLAFKNGSRPVLVKMKKKKQNKKVDLPAIGSKTVENLKDCGFSGLAFEGDGAIVINQKKVVQLADEYGLFIVGV